MVRKKREKKALGAYADRKCPGQSARRRSPVDSLSAYKINKMPETLSINAHIDLCHRISLIPRRSHFSQPTLQSAAKHIVTPRLTIWMEHMKTALFPYIVIIGRLNLPFLC